MKALRLEAPRLDLSRPRGLSPITAEEFIRQAIAEGRLLESVELENVSLRDASLVECAVNGLSVRESDLTGLSVVESSISRLNAPQLRCPRSSWRSVSITGSRVGAAELYDAELAEVHVSGSKLDLVNLRGAQLSNVLLENCQIGELDLGGATAERVQLLNCTVQTLVLTGARLSHVDLRAAEFGHLTGIEYLRGATVSSVQLQELAPHLATHAGIAVSD